MKARYSVTHYPGLGVMGTVEFDNATSQPLDWNNGAITVFDALAYCREGLRSRGASEHLNQTWEGSTPTWTSEWISL